MIAMMMKGEGKKLMMMPVMTRMMIKKENLTSQVLLV